jgi:hypothetical protein
MSIEEAKCLVMRTASFLVVLINNLVNEGVVKKMLYDNKAIMIMTARIKIFLKNRVLRTLSLAISVNSFCVEERSPGCNGWRAAVMLSGLFKFLQKRSDSLGVGAHVAPAHP